jgi:hypothetical protein
MVEMDKALEMTQNFRRELYCANNLDLSGRAWRIIEMLQVLEPVLQRVCHLRCTR